MGDLALVVFWKIENNTRCFKVSIKNKPMTERGILSFLSSAYDLLDFGAPFLLKGLNILQRTCRKILKWEEALPQNIVTEWWKWRKELHNLEGTHKKTCSLPSSFGKVIDCSLHHFSDAFENRYGQASYLRLVEEHGKIHCNLVRWNLVVQSLSI